MSPTARSHHGHYFIGDTAETVQYGDAKHNFPRARGIHTHKQRVNKKHHLQGRLLDQQRLPLFI